MKSFCPICKRQVEQVIVLPNDNHTMCVMCFLQKYMDLQEANRMLMSETQTSLYIVDRSVELQKENRSLRRFKTAYKMMKEKIEKGKLS